MNNSMMKKPTSLNRLENSNQLQNKLTTDSYIISRVLSFLSVEEYDNLNYLWSYLRDRWKISAFNLDYSNYLKLLSYLNTDIMENWSG